MNPDDAGTAFAAGKLDGAVTWEPWITKATSAGQGHVVFSSKDAPYVIIDVLVTSPRKSDRKKIEGFLRGMVKAHEFIAAHPDEYGRHCREGVRADAGGNGRDADQGQVLQQGR